MSPDVSEFRGRFPGVYEAVPPHHDGRYLYDLSAKLLVTSIPGYVFMHRDKLPPDVTTLLSERKLLLPDCEDGLS